MRLHDDWRKILRHAWSVRFILIAAGLSGFEVSIPLIQPYVSINPIYVSIGAGLASTAAFLSRVVAQKEFEGIDGT